jgi:hypothetical protein
MSVKKEFKVLAMMTNKDGTTYWMKLGRGYTNVDSSINVYLDALPRGEWKFQLRELDADDLQRRESYRNTRASQPGTAAQPALPTRANDNIPF